MITTDYADFAWEKTAQLLAIDSPSGFTDRAAKWVCAEFQQMGFNAALTTKGGVLVDLGGSDTRDGLLLDVATTMTAAHVRVKELVGKDLPGGKSMFTVRFEVKDVAELDFIRNKLMNIRDVIGSRRGQN